MNRATPKLLCLAFLILLSHLIASYGQTQPQRRRLPEGLAGGPGRFGPGYQRLLSVLTDEQKDSLRAAMDQQREKVRELEDRLRDATRDLYASGLMGSFDEDLVRKKADTVAKLEADMTVLRFKAFSRMRPQLSSEQLAKLRELPAGPGGEAPIQGELPRKRPDRPRDENGLPVKEKSTDEKKN